MSFLLDELHAKRLELLCELVPQAKAIGLLVNPNLDTAGRIIRDVREAARAMGVQVHILSAGTETEIDAAFATLVQQRVDGLLVARDGFFDSRSERLVTLASRYAVPTIYSWRLFTASVG